VGRPRVWPRDEVSGGGWVGPAKAKGGGPGWVFSPFLISSYSFSISCYQIHLQ
jgi:hypothetical protein